MFKKIYAVKTQIGTKASLSPVLADFYRNPYNAFGRNVLDFLREIVRHILTDEEVAVEWNIPEQGSFYDTRNKIIRFEPLMVEKEDDLSHVKITASHEASHAVITVTTDQRANIMQDMSDLERTAFSGLSNGLEDLRVDNWTKMAYPGVEKWQKQKYDDFCSVKDGVIDVPYLREIIEQLGRVPQFITYTMELARFWHTGHFSDDLNPELLALLEKHKPAFTQAYALIPQTRNRREIMAKARASLDIVYKQIWLNGYKDLLTEVQHLEKLSQTANRQDLRQHLQDRLTDGQKQELQNSLRNPENWSDDLKKAVEQFFNNLAQEMQQEIRQQAEKLLQAQAEAVAEHYKQWLKCVNDTTLSQEQDMAAEEQNNLAAAENAVEQSGENTENEMVTLLTQISSSQETKQAEQSDIIQLAEQADKEMANTRKMLSAKRTNWLNRYNEILLDLASEINQLTSDLGRILRANEKPKFISADCGGTRLNFKRAMQLDAGQAVWPFDKRRPPTKRDFKFIIILDMSGSMKGKNIQAAYDGLVLLCESFHRLKLPIEIIGFSDYPKVIKAEKDELNSKMRQKLNDVLNLEIDGEQLGGGTEDADAIKYAYERHLKSNRRKDTFMIVLTDGDGQDLQPVLSRIGHDRVMPSPIGLGLGSDTEHVETSYHIGLANIEPKNLNKVFVNLMQDIIKNPFKYKREN